MFRPNPKPEPKPKVKKIYRYKRKPTGEFDLFQEIWNERPHICDKCGDKLYEFNVVNFHHIKTKARFPELRLDKTNIEILCFDCHYSIHNK